MDLAGLRPAKSRKILRILPFLAEVVWKLKFPNNSNIFTRGGEM